MRSTNDVIVLEGPTAILNGKRYASASPHQFCLFPYPYAANVTSEEDENVLLLREVGAGIPAKLGRIFWASAKIPAGYEEASAREGVVPSSMMGAATQVRSKSPVATENLLANTDGVLRGRAEYLHCSLGAAPCYLLFMLARATY